MTTTTLPMRSGNPALSNETFPAIGRVGAGQDAMTIEGTVNKTALSLLLLVVAASYTWNLGVGDPRVMPLVAVGFIGGLVLAIATIFKKTWAPWTTPAYAVLEGLALGGISVGFEARYPGLVSQAVFLTFGMTIPMIHGSGTIGIVFSLVVVGVAALNLVLDFDFIEQGAASGTPKYMEWYGAFGLLVTLIWLYLELLRLLAKLQDRR